MPPAADYYPRGMPHALLRCPPVPGCLSHQHRDLRRVDRSQENRRRCGSDCRGPAFHDVPLQVGREADPLAGRWPDRQRDDPRLADARGERRREDRPHSSAVILVHPRRCERHRLLGRNRQAGEAGPHRAQRARQSRRGRDRDDRHQERLDRPGRHRAAARRADAAARERRQDPVDRLRQHAHRRCRRGCLWRYQGRLVRLADRRDDAHPAPLFQIRKPISTRS